MSLSNFISFSNDQAHFNSGVLPSFNCLCGINNGIFRGPGHIHIFQFAFDGFELSYFCFRMWSWFRIKILVDQRIWREKGTDRRICIPYSPRPPRYVRAQRGKHRALFIFSLWAPTNWTPGRGYPEWCCLKKFCFCGLLNMCKKSKWVVLQPPTPSPSPVTISCQIETLTSSKLSSFYWLVSYFWIWNLYKTDRTGHTCIKWR